MLLLLLLLPWHVGAVRRQHRVAVRVSRDPAPEAIRRRATARGAPPAPLLLLLLLAGIGRGAGGRGAVARTPAPLRQLPAQLRRARR